MSSLYLGPAQLYDNKDRSIPAQNRSDSISNLLRELSRVPIQPARLLIQNEWWYTMPQLQKCPAPDMVEPSIDLLPPPPRLDQDLLATL